MPITNTQKQFLLSQEHRSGKCLQVIGSQKLSGHIRISGAKNSSLVLMSAALLSDRSVCLSNVPLLADVEAMSKLFVSMGVELRRNKNQLKIITSGLSLVSKELSCDVFQSLRASFFCIGPLLARFGEVKIPLPGGCKIGARPIDEHIQGLRALGARVEIKNDCVVAKAISPQKRLIGARISM
jgi:UDP-N-acetylglucosamine 1-carboxyvinyltransferase